MERPRWVAKTQPFRNTCYLYFSVGIDDTFGEKVTDLTSSFLARPGIISSLAASKQLFSTRNGTMNVLVLNIIVIAEQSLNTSEDAKLLALRAIVRAQRDI